VSNYKGTVRDIYVRAHTVLDEEKAESKRTRKKSESSDAAASGEVKQWPESALIFDTETRTQMDGRSGYQALTFGIFRICRLVDGVYRCEREGIFYSGESDRTGAFVAPIRRFSK
jgi:hypothetical protein